ncbi:MAG: hypothetical protein HeimC2_09720 [Candidatus Heimdallarchaeota archaeon LC_2]|nr:MAG: hypothetical protein HeimC2_09720 [Candidatus Heimdallarchaeota archaeon LC_2]
MLETRKYFLISVAFITFLTVGTLYISNIDNSNTNVPVGGKDRPYYFRIELSQWTMKIIDLNQIEDLMLEGNSAKKAFSVATYIDSMGKLEKGSRVYFQIYSLDVQHGISINELNIYISILESTDDIDSTIPEFYDFQLPETDTSFTAYCQVYCGLGHSNMKFRFEIGNGDPSYGKIFFNVFVILIAILATIFSYLISSPIRRKVYLTYQSNDNSKLLKSSLQIFDLYDISTLSEKELVALRQGYFDVAKAGELLHSFEAQSYEDVRSSIIFNKQEEAWELFEFRK